MSILFYSCLFFVFVDCTPLRYGERAQYCENEVGKKLLLLMDTKKTNVGLAADVTCKEQLLCLADSAGPEICILKIHIDIIEDFDLDLIHQLQYLAHKHNFLIFEDRKFADIGNTVRLQYEKGVYRIADWADLITVHTIAGPGIIAGLKTCSSKKVGLIVLPQMSSQGSLAQGEYTQKTIAIARAHADSVIGFIARQKLVDDVSFLHITPGVQFTVAGDGLGQQYIYLQNMLYNHVDQILLL